MSVAEQGRRRAARDLPTGVNFVISLLLAVAAVALRDPYALLLVGTANLLYFILNRAPWRLLTKAGRVFLWQSIVLLLLHYLRFGADGLPTGIRISCQLCLAFLPGMIFLRATSRSQLVSFASRFLSAKSAFVLGASFHFLPLLIKEVKDIYQVQLLRGARIDSGDIAKPWCWPDWIGCLIVPCTVQALTLAGDIAQAARIRDFGVSPRRTCWPGGDPVRTCPLERDA